MKNPPTRCPSTFIAGLRLSRLPSLLLRCGMLALACTSARANVYATKVRLNGGTTNVALAPGGSVTIGYLLNEPATLGVTVAIKQGASTVRTISLAGGGPGTAPGTNAVSWD